MNSYIHTLFEYFNGKQWLYLNMMQARANV